MRLRLIASVLFVSGISAVVACPGSLSDPDRFFDAGTEDGSAEDAPILEPIDSGADTAPFVCPDILNTLFPQTCALSGCHSQPDAGGDMDLQGANVLQRLYNVPSTGNPAIKRIDPQNPEQSALYTKLTPTPPFGARMPPLPIEGLAPCMLDFIKLVVLSDGGTGVDGTR